MNNNTILDRVFGTEAPVFAASKPVNLDHWIVINTSNGPVHSIIKEFPVRFSKQKAHFFAWRLNHGLNPVLRFRFWANKSWQAHKPSFIRNYQKRRSQKRHEKFMRFKAKLARQNTGVSKLNSESSSWF